MEISLENLYVDIGAEGLKGSLNVSPSSTGLLIRVWNCFFVQRVVAQSIQMCF